MFFLSGKSYHSLWLLLAVNLSALVSSSRSVVPMERGGISVVPFRGIHTERFKTGYEHNGTEQNGEKRNDGERIGQSVSCRWPQNAWLVRGLIFRLFSGVTAYERLVVVLDHARSRRSAFPTAAAGTSMVESRQL